MSESRIESEEHIEVVPQESNREEIEYPACKGYILMPIFFLIMIVGLILIIYGALDYNWAMFGIGIAFFVLTSFFMFTFFIIDPNEAVIVMFCGKYLGSIKSNGFFWLPPFLNKELMSLKYQNYETPRQKVNDITGNPIKISAVFIWKIENTAKAFFDIQNINSFVASQSETAIRKLASCYPYDIDNHDFNKCLRGGGPDINHRLVEELQLRLNKAGVKVKDARISSIAYSEEIAQIMLRRQQADAVISARQKIVSGGVGIVAMAIDNLNNNKVCELTREDRVKLASNLLTVIVSESSGDGEKTTMTSSEYAPLRGANTGTNPLQHNYDSWDY